MSEENETSKSGDSVSGRNKPGFLNTHGVVPHGLLQSI